MSVGLARCFGLNFIIIAAETNTSRAHYEILDNRGFIQLSKAAKPHSYLTNVQRLATQF